MLECGGSAVCSPTALARGHALALVTAVFVLHGVPADSRAAALALVALLVPFQFSSAVDRPAALEWLRAFLSKKECAKLADDAAELRRAAEEDTLGAELEAWGEASGIALDASAIA